MVRRVAIQGDVRQMVGAEDVRHIGLHRLPDALNVEGAELLVPPLDVGNSPVLPAVPRKERVIFVPAHASVKEETSPDEVVAVDFHGRLGVQDMDVVGRHILVAGLLQRLLEGASPELVVAERCHRGKFGGEQIAEEGVQAADEATSGDYNHLLATVMQVVEVE